MLHTNLLHCIHPVRIIVVHIVLREGRIIVELPNVRSLIIETRIEIGLFHEHGIVVTIEHTYTIRLIGHIQAIRIGDTRRTTRTALGLNHNHTIGTLRSPNRCSSSIFEYINRLNIVWVNTKELGKLLLIGTGKIKVIITCRFEHVAIHNDERFCIAINGRNATQTHCCSTTKVTRVHNNIKTGNTSLQRFVNRGKVKSLKLRHLQALR